MEGALDLWIYENGYFLLKGSKPLKHELCGAIGCCRRATISCSALPVNRPFTIACDLHQNEGTWVNPLLDMGKFAHAVIDSRHSAYPGKDDGFAAFQFGQALSPFVNLDKGMHLSPLGLVKAPKLLSEYKYVRGVLDMVVFYKVTNSIARTSVLFVVAYLPLYIKDLRILIGKLLWNKYRLAWIDDEFIPDTKYWE